jgi:hypothetical protein
VFRSTAEGETGHAHGHLQYLEEVGDPATGEPIGATDDNLKAAIAGETHEYTDMYPGMARAARDEGFEEIADWPIQKGPGYHGQLTGFIPVRQINSKKGTRRAPTEIIRKRASVRPAAAR